MGYCTVPDGVPTYQGETWYRDTWTYVGTKAGGMGDTGTGRHVMCRGTVCVSTWPAGAGQECPTGCVPGRSRRIALEAGMATRKLDMFGAVADACVGASRAGHRSVPSVRRVSGMHVESKSLDRRQVKDAYKRNQYSEETPDLINQVGRLVLVVGVRNERVWVLRKCRIT